MSDQWTQYAVEWAETKEAAPDVSHISRDRSIPEDALAAVPDAGRIITRTVTIGDWSVC